jgi:hypothetical protein
MLLTKGVKQLPCLCQKTSRLYYHNNLINPLKLSGNYVYVITISLNIK